MKSFSTSEKLLIEEIMQASQAMKVATRGLSIGELIKLIRSHLGLSQTALARRAGVPQSTVSRVEAGKKDVSLSTLQKILEASSCDLILAPTLKEPVAVLRYKQAKKMAEKRVRYLKGTMNLEDQQPDSRFIEELLKQEIERFLQGPNLKLWEE
jgi:transcriptional regulator with XRE-family HTH domain